MTLERANERIARFGDRPFRIADAVDAGIPRYELYRLRDHGKVISVGRGVFRRADSLISANTDLATVSARVPHGTMCLNSALSYWDLTDELPEVVHLAVPRGTHRPQIDYPTAHVHVFAAATFDLDRWQEITETGESLWIYSPERSVVDAIRLAHLVGRDVAFHGLTRYMSRPKARPRKLVELARQLGGLRRLTDALEVVLS